MHGVHIFILTVKEQLGIMYKKEEAGTLLFIKHLMARFQTKNSKIDTKLIII